MPKYALRRHFSPLMTRAELDGMALASMAALESYLYRGGNTPHSGDHGIRWIRSYWEPGSTFGMCLYEAPTLEVLQDYQYLCNLPFLDAKEVVEVPGPLDRSTTKAAHDRVAVSIRLDGAFADPVGALSEVVASRSAAALVRAYWDEQEQLATALFETDDGDEFAECVASIAEHSHPRIVEISPEEYR